MRALYLRSAASQAGFPIGPPAGPGSPQDPPKLACRRPPPPRAAAAPVRVPGCSLVMLYHILYPIHSDDTVSYTSRLITSSRAWESQPGTVTTRREDIVRGDRSSTPALGRFGVSCSRDCPSPALSKSPPHIGHTQEASMEKHPLGRLLWYLIESDSVQIGFASFKREGDPVKTRCRS